MTFTGHILDGRVVLDAPAPLPDGTAVTVAPAANGAAAPAPIINPQTGLPYPSYIPRETAERMRRQDSGESSEEERMPFLERYKNVIGVLDDPTLPTDRALNHDHYLYGTPKKPT